MAKKVKFSAKSSVKKDGKVVDLDSLIKVIRASDRTVSAPIIIKPDSTKTIYQEVEQKVEELKDEVADETKKQSE